MGRNGSLSLDSIVALSRRGMICVTSVHIKPTTSTRHSKDYILLTHKELYFSYTGRNPPVEGGDIALLRLRYVVSG